MFDESPLSGWNSWQFSSRISTVSMKRALTILAVASLAVAARVSAQSTIARPQRPYRPGIEVLLADSMHLVQGKRVGLITNHSGVLRDGRSTIDALARAPGVRLTALFAPEHGIRGQAHAGEKIATTVDSATGVTVYSLYGETRVPTEEMLEDVDVLLYDIQDLGARTYTFPWTMALSANAAKRPFIVLDRPNPIRADRVEGGVLEPAFRSFVGQYPVAMRYGMTPGELLLYLAGTGQVSADVKVVPMDGYRRDMWWSDTGWPWANPSPNIRSPDAALLYTGTVLFEGTNVSEGRGTPMPFQLIGASWLGDAGQIARELNAKRLAGVVFDSTLITMEKGFKFPEQRIPMIVVTVSDRDIVRPHVVGLHLLRAIYARHPRDFGWRNTAIDRLAGSDRLRAAVEREGGIEALIPVLDRESAEFAKRIAPYLLYR
ncbi:MAG: hypothetical protein MNPFHGCM_00201 [Gemmatimonadaceae bacterium]|nr:hypothetical protein [Gemmatimonadaceae bacterium]